MRINKTCDFCALIGKSYSLLTGSFADSELMKLTSMQLVAAMELLVSHSSLWVTSCGEEGWSVVRDICAALHASVRDLGKEMLSFLQVNTGTHR